MDELLPPRRVNWTPVLAPRRPMRISRRLVWLPAMTLQRFLVMPVIALLLVVSCNLGQVAAWAQQE